MKEEMPSSSCVVLEVHCWCDMTHAQLLTRLGRTKNRARLDCFIRMAEVKGAVFLEREGHYRWNFLFVDQHTLQRSSMARMNQQRFRDLCKSIEESKEESKIIREPEFRVIR